jgi:hypothetical protein
MHVTAAFGVAKELCFPMAVRFGLFIVGFISSFSAISVTGEIGIGNHCPSRAIRKRLDHRLVGGRRQQNWAGS